MVEFFSLKNLLMNSCILYYFTDIRFIKTFENNWLFSHTKILTGYCCKFMLADPTGDQQETRVPELGTVSFLS